MRKVYQKWQVYYFLLLYSDLWRTTAWRTTAAYQSSSFAETTQIVFDFFAFRNYRKVGKFAASIEPSKVKSILTLGGFAPWPPDQGLCPWTPLGDSPQTPVGFRRGPPTF